MSTTTVRIAEETHQILRALAEESGQPMSEVLAEAIEMLRRRRLLEQSNAAYAVLRADPTAWQAEQQERQAWETTLVDGLEQQ